MRVSRCIRFQMHRTREQHGCGAVSLQIDPHDQAIPQQKRQQIITMRPFIGRHIYFDAIAKPEQSLMLPAMLAALAVVCEKEIGSIINLYMTPVSRSKFLLGKQLPYVVLALINFLLMVLMAIFIFGVPVKGSFPTFLLAASIYRVTATAWACPPRPCQSIWWSKG